MLSNENFILAPLEIKKARKRLLIASIFIFSIFLSIYSQILSFPFQNNNKELFVNQLINIQNRANIIDRNGRILATTIPAWSIYADPNEVLDPNKSASVIHKLIPEKDLDILTKK